MYTRSGTRLEIIAGTPSLEDIAWQLAHIPRWAGATDREWSVLDHSLMMMDLCDVDVATGLSERTDPVYSPARSVEHPGTILTTPEAQLWAGFHDVHEICTGDVPAPFKPPQVKDIQVILDKRYYSEVLGLELPDSSIVASNRFLDEACTAAEAHVLMHPSVRADFSKPDTLVISMLMHRLGLPRHRQMSFRSELEWLTRIRRLVLSLGGLATPSTDS